MIKKERNYLFIDKIGTLTNILISTIPKTELQRNGQYGALIIKNLDYNFESQITSNESNFTLNMEQIIDDKFAEYYETVIDVSEKIITTIKKATDSNKDLKSIICLISGKVSTDKKEKIKTLLLELSKNSLIDEDSNIKEINYIWKKSFCERFISISDNEEDGGDSLVSFAIQDFQKDDMNFSNVKSVVDQCLREFQSKILTKIDE
jgi:hypothetical protein